MASHPGVPPLLGRDGELARIDALLAAARAGRSSALVVHGPAGSGKTALLDTAAARAEGFVRLRAAAVEAETDVPHAALGELLAPVLDLRARIPAPQRAALERALALADAAEEPAGRDRFAVGAGVVSLLGAVAEPGPVLAVADDAQWLDAASLDALRFAVRRLVGEGVAVLLAARGDERPAVDLPHVERLRLAPLDDGAAAALVRARAAAPVAPAVVERVVQLAGGLPLAIVGVVDSLSDAELAGRLDFAEPLPPGASAATLYERRLEALPARARAALAVAAAFGDDRTGLLAAALDGAGLAPADLEDAERARLVVLEAGRVRFRHPLARAAAYHAAAPPDRRRAHAAVAAALPEDDPRRPWHLAAAATGPDERLAAALERAAAEAGRRGGCASAAHARLRAAELSVDPDGRARRLVAAAGDLLVAGRLEEAGGALDAALAEPVAADVEALARATRAEVELRDGRPAGACAALSEQARRLAAAGDPVGAGLAALKAALAAMVAGDAAGWRREAGRARETLSAAPPPLPALAAGMAASASLAGGEPGASRELRRAAEDLQALPALLRAGTLPVGGSVEIATLVAQASAWAEQWEDAHAIVDGLVGALRDLVAPTALVYPLTVRAWLDFRGGRWDSALATAGEGVALARQTGQRTALAAALAVRAVVRAARGDAEGCRADVAEARGHVEHTAAAGTAAYPSTALGLLALGDGDAATAIAELGRARTTTAAAGVREPGAMPWAGDLLEALVRAGRVEEARASTAQLRALPATAERSSARALLARCDALLAPDAEVDAAFARALDGDGLPFERARTLLAFGERRRRARRPGEARAPLREALAAFDELGAVPWARRARHELRATGAAVPPVSAPVLAGLTAHEVQVAALVAEGRTNREIAAALFIAPKTVEHHLSRIFRKLGVRRRAEVARLAAGLRPGGSSGT